MNRLDKPKKVRIKQRRFAGTSDLPSAARSSKINLQPSFATPTSSSLTPSHAPAAIRDNGSPDLLSSIYLAPRLSLNGRRDERTPSPTKHPPVPRQAAIGEPRDWTESFPPPESKNGFEAPSRPPTAQSQAIVSQSRRPITRSGFPKYDCDELIRESRITMTSRTLAIIATEKRDAHRARRDRGLLPSVLTAQEAARPQADLMEYEETSPTAEIKQTNDYLDERVFAGFGKLSVGEEGQKDVESTQLPKRRPENRPLFSFLSDWFFSKKEPLPTDNEITLKPPKSFGPGRTTSPEPVEEDENGRLIQANVLPVLDDSEADEALVTQSRPAQEKIVKGLDNEFLTGHDFQKLEPGDWLNDAIINAYVPLIAKTKNEASEKPPDGDPPPIVFFNSFLGSRLEARRRDNKPWREFFRGSNKKGIGGDKILKSRLIIIPVNEGSNHWVLLTVYPQLREIHYLNSIRRSHSKHAELVKEWLTAQLLDAQRSREDAENWNVVVEDVPQQRNGCDCGVFTLTNARLLAYGLSPLSVGQENMQDMRRLITWELMYQKMKASSE